MRELSPYEWVELCLRGDLSRNDIISHIDYISSDREHYLALYPDHEGRLFLINQNDTYVNVSKVKEHKEDILRLICL